MENDTQENTAPEKRGFDIKLNLTIVIIILSVVIVSAGLFLKKDRSHYEGYVASPAKSVGIDDISASATDIPPPITRTDNKNVVINLDAVQLVGELADGTTYEYWTFNKQVPGPFIRVMEGDTVEVFLTHSHDHVGINVEENEDFLHSFTIDSFIPLALAQEHEHEPETSDEHTHDDVSDNEEMATEEHTEAGHGEHSIDLHAVLGPGGGAELMRVGPNETLGFKFKATRPGIYIYHCASPHVPTHIANGMYGMILVEPVGGLSPVDREYYVVQGEFYTKGAVGETGHQEYSLKKLMKEEPEYVVFNGRMGALTGDGALKAKTGETIRIFFGASGQLAANFHIIGEIMDKLYREGDILSPPAQNVQTTIVPAGGAMMTEFTAEVPGTYLLVDHALSRAIDRGAVGQLVVEGPDRPDLIEKVQ